jgi:hypothetical protein
LNPCLGLLLYPSDILLHHMGWILGWWRILCHVVLRHLVSQLKETLLVESIVSLSVRAVNGDRILLWSYRVSRARVARRLVIDFSIIPMPWSEGDLEQSVSGGTY